MLDSPVSGIDFTKGDLREQVENSRQITNEQQAILDKIERVRRFFESLQGICNSVKEVSLSTALFMCMRPDETP